MAKRPKVGARVRFFAWTHRKEGVWLEGNTQDVFTRRGIAVPEKHKWTGVVTEITPGSRVRIYHVRRDYDGEIISCRSSEMELLT